MENCPRPLFKRWHEGKEARMKNTRITVINFLPEEMPLHSEIFKYILCNLMESILEIYIPKLCYCHQLNFFELWMEKYFSTVSPPSPYTSLSAPKTVNLSRSGFIFPVLNPDFPVSLFHITSSASLLIAPTVQTLKSIQLHVIICGPMSYE